MCVCGVCLAQRTLQTHVTAPDVVGCLQTQTASGLGGGATPTPDHRTAAGREERSREQEVDASAKPASVHVDLSQVGSHPTEPMRALHERRSQFRSGSVL